MKPKKKRFLLKTNHGYLMNIGVDLVQIPRIEKILEQYDKKFAVRILSNKELERYYLISNNEQRVAFLAKRFAAKEAIAKAFGTGFDGKIFIKEISVLNNKLGQPYVIFENPNFNSKKISISLSDDYPIAVAFCIIY